MGKVLLLRSEGCGYEDATLGFEILVTLLKTLPKRQDRPAAIICWNTAVNLLAEGFPLLPHFRRLEEEGFKFLAGQFGVAELGLMGKIARAKVATMDEIRDLMLHNDVIRL